MTLKKLLDQKAALEAEIASIRTKERSEAVNRAREIMSEYGLSVTDVLGRTKTKGSGRSGAAKGTKVPAKYRNAATGDSWSGRGLQPKWLKAALAAGRKIGDFAV